MVSFNWCMERYPFSLRVIADVIFLFIRNFSTDILICKVIELCRYDPLACLRVADGVLAVCFCWLLATFPESRVIEPFELNPFAIETDSIFQMGWDIGTAAISWESFVRALFNAFLRLGRIKLDMHCLCGAHD